MAFARNKLTMPTEGIKLEEVRIVIGGGRDLGSPEGFRPLQALATVLGAGIGASRAAGLRRFFAFSRVWRLSAIECLIPDVRMLLPRWEFATEPVFVLFVSPICSTKGLCVSSTVEAAPPSVSVTGGFALCHSGQR
jgi:hypothetical protein